MPQRPQQSSNPPSLSSAPLPGLAASAASRLPRWAIAWLLGLYIIQGLFHRDPWRGDDLMGIALARSAAQTILSGDLSAVFGVQLAGIAWSSAAPLWPLIQAIFMLPVYGWAAMTDSPLAIGLLDDLARIPIGLALAIGFLALWKSADRFARRREAQPLDPLGVGPRSQDFGKTLGDCAFLLAVSSLGAIYPWHQSGSQPAVFMLQSLMLWSLATAPEAPRRAARHAAWLIAAMLLSHGVGLAAAWFVALLGIFLLVKPYQLVAGIFFRKFAGLFAAIIGVIAIGAWLTGSLTTVQSWLSTQLQGWGIARMLEFSPQSWSHIRRWFLDSLWKWWPLWPIALFGLWRNRHVRFLSAPQWSVPLIALVCILAAGLFGAREWQLQQLGPIAALALIAAFGLLSMPRPLVNLIDWFAVVLFTALAVFIWLYWTALNFGFPKNFAERIPVVAPGITGNANIYEISIGVLATVAWIGLVAWRIGRGSPKLWRPVVLSAGGLTLAWTLLITLWIPAIDRIQGQSTLARSLERAWLTSARQAFGAGSVSQWLSKYPDACVMSAPAAISPTVMAAALTELPLKRAGPCRWMLSLRDADIPTAGATTSPGQWKIIWQSRSSEDRRSKERYVLLERAR